MGFWKKLFRKKKKQVPAVSAPRPPAQTRHVETQEEHLQRLARTYTEQYHREFTTDGYQISDPLTFDRDFMKIEGQVNLKVEAEMARRGLNRYNFGICHAFWDIKKRILKEEYNIDWLTPSELSPYTHFD